MNFFGVGGFEIIVVAGLAFLLLGPKKMIETSRSAGKILRDLRNERDKLTKMVMQEFDVDADESSAAIPAATGATEDEPDGAVSRPRGPLQGKMDSAADDASDGPNPPAGGSA